MYCYQTDGEQTAFSYSSAVDSFGGAGYILEYGGTFYVTAACYYSYDDAYCVCKTLNARNKSCGVLTAQRAAFDLTTRKAKKLSREYAATINTLQQISLIIYRCANGLDTAQYGEAEAKDIMRGVRKSLAALIKENTDNCFAAYLPALALRCDECIYESTFSKNLRAAQIAVADTILNINLT